MSMLIICYSLCYSWCRLLLAFNKVQLWICMYYVYVKWVAILVHLQLRGFIICSITWMNLYSKQGSFIMIFSFIIYIYCIIERTRFQRYLFRWFTVTDSVRIRVHTVAIFLYGILWRLYSFVRVTRYIYVLYIWIHIQYCGSRSATVAILNKWSYIRLYV